MSTSTNSNTTIKIVRIRDDERKVLSQLREIYANDYRKYSEYIRREPHVPEAVKQLYKGLDERKAYRRISDYFHRKRRSTKTNGITKSYHRSLIHSLTKVPESMSPVQDDDDSLPSITLTISNDSNELIEANHLIPNHAQQIPTTSSVNSNHPSKITPISLSSINPASDLLSVRASIQKALYELDRVILSKSDTNQNEQEEKVDFLTNGHSHSKLNNTVRSLSTVVSQQQDNVRLIINQSSTLLINDNKQSIKYILERLNTFIDRGHSIYNRIENILSDLS